MRAPLRENLTFVRQAQGRETPTELKDDGMDFNLPGEDYPRGPLAYAMAQSLASDAA